MINNIKKNMTSDNVAVRIITTCILLFIFFFTITILSYYLLPQGLLLNKNSIKNWDTSPNLIISALQIISYNLISVIVLLFGNIFLVRKNKSQCFMPLGYLGFFAMISVNAVTLGTWSFSVITTSIPLIQRIIGIFDILHRAGLWEMIGQLFIVCATVKISLIITDGKETTTKSWKTIKLSRQEITIISLGLILMLIGAFIESYAIIHLN